MTYNYNKEQHTAKIKTGLETAKKKGKKLGRPKGGKIKGEDEVIAFYKLERQTQYIYNSEGMIKKVRRHTYGHIAECVGVSKGTVQKIINKYRNEN